MPGKEDILMRVLGGLVAAVLLGAITGCTAVAPKQPQSAPSLPALGVPSALDVTKSLNGRYLLTKATWASGGDQTPRGKQTWEFKEGTGGNSGTFALGGGVSGNLSISRPGTLVIGFNNPVTGALVKKTYNYGFASDGRLYLYNTTEALTLAPL